MKRKAWEYIFFLDMEGHIADGPIAEALEDLKQYCQFVITSYSIHYTKLYDPGRRALPRKDSHRDARGDGRA